MLTPQTTEKPLAAGARAPRGGPPPPGARPRPPPRAPPRRARPAGRARLQLPLVLDARRPRALRRHRPDALGPVPRQPGPAAAGGPAVAVRAPGRRRGLRRPHARAARPDRRRPRPPVRR